MKMISNFRSPYLHLWSAGIAGVLMLSLRSPEDWTQGLHVKGNYSPQLSYISNLPEASILLTPHYIPDTSQIHRDPVKLSATGFAPELIEHT